MLVAPNNYKGRKSVVTPTCISFDILFDSVTIVQGNFNQRPENNTFPWFIFKNSISLGLNRHRITLIINFILICNNNFIFIAPKCVA